MVAINRRVIIAGIAVAGFAAGVVVYHSGWRNGSAESACTLADAATTRMRPLAVGEVAAVQVENHPAPLKPLAFLAPDGSPVTLADFKGKTVLLNLWATWCVPCRAEMPALNTLQEKLGSDRFEVVAVNIDTRDPEKAIQWLKDNRIDHLAPYADPKAKIFQTLRSEGKAFGMPTTVLVDAEGCALGHLAGAAEWASDDAIALIRAALEG